MSFPQSRSEFSNAVCRGAACEKGTGADAARGAVLVLSEADQLPEGSIDAVAVKQLMLDYVSRPAIGEWRSLK